MLRGLPSQQTDVERPVRYTKFQTVNGNLENAYSTFTKYLQLYCSEKDRRIDSSVGTVTCLRAGRQKSDNFIHSVIGERMSMDSRWNDTAREKPKNMEKGCPGAIFLHHKSHTVWPETKRGPKANRLILADWSKSLVVFYEYNAKQYTDVRRPINRCQKTLTSNTKRAHCVQF